MGSLIELQTTVTNADREIRSAFQELGIEHKPDGNSIRVSKGSVSEFSLFYTLPPTNLGLLLQCMRDRKFYGEILQPSGGQHVQVEITRKFNL